MSDGEYGRVIETVTFNRRTKLTYKFEKIYVFIAQIRKIQVGDKIAGRHGIKELFHVFYLVRICHFYLTEHLLTLF
jgi:DNA-directed RNA polymerase beta subunit